MSKNHPLDFLKTLFFDVPAGPGDGQLIQQSKESRVQTTHQVVNPTLPAFLAHSMKVRCAPVKVSLTLAIAKDA